MPSPLTRFASSLGEAFGQFRGSYRTASRGYARARLIGSMSQEAQWSGGSWVREASERRAIQSAWVSTAIGMIAREAAAAAQTFEVVQKIGNKQIGVPNHPLEIVMDSPNPWMGSNFFWQYTMWWLQLDGNAYWFVGTGEEGEERRNVFELWPLPSHRVEPAPNASNDKTSFIKNYFFTSNGIQYTIPAEYIVHFMLPNPFDLYRGMSPLMSAMLAVDSDMAMAQWNGAFFGRNNVMPSAIVNLSTGDPNVAIDPDDKAALEEDLRAEYSAAERRTLVTTAQKVDVNLLGWNPREMDFVEGRKTTKEEIFDVYGVPVGLISENSTQANSDTADRLFKEKTIWPLITLIGEQIGTELLAPFYGRQYRVKFKDIRPTDKAQESQDINNANAYLSIDEMRQKFWQLKPFNQPWSKVPAALSSNLISSASTDVIDAATYTPPAQISNGQPDNNQPHALPAPTSNTEPTVSDTSVPNAPEAQVTVKDLRPYARDMRQWRVKSLNRLKDGRSPQVKFIPATKIDEDILIQIKHGLAIATTPDEVKAAFNVEPWKASARPWSAFEQKLYETLRGALSNEAQRISAALAGGGPAILDSEQLWTEHRERLLRAIQPILTDLSSYGAHQAQGQLMASHPEAVEISWNLVNERAKQFAQQYAYDLVRGLTETSKAQLQQATSKWIEQGKPLADLVQNIANISLTDEQGQLLHPFNPVRARLIAMTEATRAYAESNNVAFAEAGIPAAMILPATGSHPACRCYISPYRLPSHEWVIIWYTVRDERVCTAPFTTPWGEKEGCKAMHQLVISGGRYGGMTLDEAIKASQGVQA
jgi:HK97 family phage portal protein